MWADAAMRVGLGLRIEWYVEQGGQFAAERLRALAVEPAQGFEKLVQESLDHPDRAACDLAPLVREGQLDRPGSAGSRVRSTTPAASRARASFDT